jgi:hypothetical protein
MTPARIAAAAVLGLRVAYGLALIAAPERLTRAWLGAAGGTAPTQVALRGLGAREIALHGAALAAAVAGAPVRPWLAVSVAGDLSDIAATAAAGGPLPSGATAKTAAAAGASALATVAVAAAVDR